MRAYLTLLTLLFVFTLASGALHARVEFPVPPKSAYIHVAAGDSAGSATIISLAGLGVVPGNCLRIRTLGDFDNGPLGDTVNSSIGLFSADATLLDESLLNRVPGAIDAGLDFVTNPTYVGNEPTDIPEDFRITSATQDHVIVRVPAGATHLFVGIHDSLWHDNSDPDGDYRVEITEVACWFDVGPALAGTAGDPHLDGSGLLLGGDPVNLDLTNARAIAPTYLIVGTSELFLPFMGGLLVPSPDLVISGLFTDAMGEIHLATTWPSGIPGDIALVCQAWIIDPAAPAGVAASQGLEWITP